MNNFTIFISFKDSLQIYPNNQAHTFIVQLPKSLNLCSETWQCAVNSILVHKSEGAADTPTLIKTDLCEESICYGSYSSVLAEFLLKKAAGWQRELYTFPRYISLRKDSVRFITVSIQTLKENERLALLDVRLQLSFEKIKKVKL